uniref:Ovule protein n=1 Tax=Elaeophora elaphi TaxID=1147741 RepID=A0A0R3RGM3_9BILA
MLGTMLNDVLDQKSSLKSDPRKMKKKESKRRVKLTDRTNINAEELEYQRLLNEVCIITLCCLISTVQY